MKLSATAVSLLFLTISFGQFNRTMNWALGENAFIDFNSSFPTVGTSSIDAFEGSSTMSDLNGNLLFYTNGVSVWNSQHQLMDNGSGLFGGLSATNAAIIVPKPNSDSLYYIFTLEHYVLFQNGTGIFGYSIVDMSQNGGLGKVVVKNVPLYTNSTEKLCVTKHANGTDYWILTHRLGTSQFYSYRLSSSGIHGPIISDSGAIHEEEPVDDWGQFANGSMRFSPSGCQVALVLSSVKDSVQLFDFDNGTGYVFNPITLLANAGEYDQPYALSFSPNNQLLYVTSQNYLIQYDLTSNDQIAINASKYIVEQNTLLQTGSPKYLFGDLQIAPNGKIYISRISTNYLSAINLPNVYGAGCAYQASAVVFPIEQCTYGLPNFVQNFTIPNNVVNPTCTNYCPSLDLGADLDVCEGDMIFLSPNLPIGSYLWSTGETSSNIGVTAPGMYALAYQFNNCPVVTDSVFVNVTSSPVLNLGNDTTLCLENPFVLTVPQTSGFDYLWNDGTTGTQIGVTQTGEYWVEATSLHCFFSDSIKIIQFCPSDINMPNVFTPNGDETNDYFLPISMVNISEAYLIILNRWGSVVFESKNNYIKWDGSSNGVNCSDGVYFWKLTFTDSKGNTISTDGFVHLQRE
jgi:gliding motility-associated-like protein